MMITISNFAFSFRGMHMQVKATLVRLMGASDQLVQLAAAIALDVAGLV